MSQNLSRGSDTFDRPGRLDNHPRRHPLHRRQRGRGTLQLLWHARHTGGVHDPVSDGRRRTAGSHDGKRGAGLFSSVRFRRLFHAAVRRAAGGWRARQIPLHHFFVIDLLPGPLRPGLGPHPPGAAPGAGIDRDRRRRHQTLRDIARRRPVRRLQPAADGAGVRLVLFRHQSRRLCRDAAHPLAAGPSWPIGGLCLARRPDAAGDAGVLE